MLATIGDPVLLLAPVAGAAVGIAAVLVLGAPARVETVVPLWSLPPFGAYQDAGAVDLAVRAVPLVLVARAVLLVVRAVTFGACAHLAMQRAADATPSLARAFAAVRGNLARLCTIELIGWAVFAIPLVLGQGSILEAGRPVSQLGLLVGEILLVNAYFAALDGAPARPALRAGVAWAGRRPLGHVATAVLATAVSNGIVWVARAGEVASARTVTLALYAAAHAVATSVFLAAFARRYRLLYAPSEPTADTGPARSGDA
jgi:hypothetical protein